MCPIADAQLKFVLFYVLNSYLLYSGFFIHGFLFVVHAARMLTLAQIRYYTILVKFNLTLTIN